MALVGLLLGCAGLNRVGGAPGMATIALGGFARHQSLSWHPPHHMASALPASSTLTPGRPFGYALDRTASAEVQPVP